jgi:hypothetical protein
MFSNRHIKPFIIFFTALHLLGYSLTSAWTADNPRHHKDDRGSEIVLIGESVPVTIVPLHKFIITAHALADAVSLPVPSIKGRKSFSATIQIYLQNKYPRWSSSTFL